LGCVSRLKLDFEDEPPDDDDGVAASEEEQEGDGDADSDEEGAAFEDAMENLTISDQPRLVAATA
jgi:diphthamide biosynthesis protein 3